MRWKPARTRGKKFGERLRELRKKGKPDTKYTPYERQLAAMSVSELERAQRRARKTLGALGRRQLSTSMFKPSQQRRRATKAREALLVYHEAAELVDVAGRNGGKLTPAKVRSARKVAYGRAFPQQ